MGLGVNNALTYPNYFAMIPTGPNPKMVGASMIGPQNTAVKTTLGPLLNGLVNYEYWVPVRSMAFPGVQEFQPPQHTAKREDTLTV